MKLSVKRAAAAAAAFTITATGFAVASQPASAAASDCPSHYACLWPNTGYSGARWQGQNANPTLPSWISNKSKSAYNHGVNCSVNWHYLPDYAGVPMVMARGTGMSDLGSWEDNIMSMNWC